MYKATDSLQMPERLEAERLYLKRIGVEYAPTLYQIIETEKERLVSHLPHMAGVRSLQDEETWLIEMEEKWSEGKAFGYGIFAHEYDFFLGHIAVINVEWAHRGCELGYWIRDAGEGKGYMTEAVKTLESAVFDAGFHRVEIRVASNNTRSEEIPRRCGFQLEGRLRDCLRLGDEFRDLFIFAKLRAG